MRVFVAGASGAIGTRLVPQLIDAGHEVIGTVRSQGNAERVRALGAKPVALDLLDARAVRKAVLASEPEAIVHQATALANLRDLTSTSTAASRRPTVFGRRAPTRCSPPRTRRACAASSPRASRPMGGTRVRVGRSRPRTTRSTPPRCRRCARPSPRCDTSTRPSPTPAGSRFATAPSTAPPTTGSSSRCASASSRSSATAAGSGRSIHLEDAAAATVLALEHDGARRLQRRRRRARPGARVAAGARGCARRQAAPPLSPLARAAVRGRSGGDDGNRVPRRLEREGQARAGLGAALPELAPGLRGRLRVNRACRATRARSGRPRESLALSPFHLTKRW